MLEAVGKLRALAVDKTGTITEGKPRVTKVVASDSTDREPSIVRIAAAIDTHSEHPLAQAVVAYANEKKVEFPRSENYQASGRGAEGDIVGHPYFVGNHRFAHELAVCSPEIEKHLAEIEADAQSVVVVGHKPHADCTGEVLGILAVGDTIRANAADAIAASPRRGSQKSRHAQRRQPAHRQRHREEGRHRRSPRRPVARPEDRARPQRYSLLTSYVGMIGDGVNDAPAMAAATVGIAMGAAGTDTAIETADMALMQDDLSKVAEAIHLGRRTVRIIQFNIAFRPRA